MVDRCRKVRERVEGDQDGFTVIELLMVVVILGILAAVTVFGLGGVTSRSAVSACRADARSVEVAVEVYHARSATGGWPTNIDVQLVKGSPVYLRTAPNNAHYKITLGATGQVLVSPNGGTAQDYDITEGGVCDAVT